MQTTIPRETVTAVANRMIEHLSKSGTRTDATRREAIREVVTAILIESDAYGGFGYLNAPTMVPQPSGWSRSQYDETRIYFH